MLRRFLLACLFFSLLIVPLRLNTHLALAEPASPDLRLWVDGAGDLQIETPLFTWNLTSGAEIYLRSGAGRVWARSQAGGPLLNELFLFSTPGETSAQIVYALPDEALVRVDRSTPGGKESLWLAFQSSTALIALWHGWQGESLPSPLTASSETRPALSAAGPGSRVSYRSGALSSAQGALLPLAFEYHAAYDYLSGLGAAVLQSPDQPWKVPASALLPSCSPYHGSVPAQSADLCPAGASLPSETADAPSALRYLLLFQSGRTDPLQPLRETALRLQLALPDLNAASIGRTPRYDYDQPKSQPYPGELVVFSGRVANRGGAPSGPFAYSWSIDGQEVAQGSYEGLQPGELIELSINWSWQPGPQHIALHVDPQGLIDEVSEKNNRVEDRTDALALGLWVEQSVYDWFNQRQAALGLGAVSWDDWAQRQVRLWNQMFAQAVHPLTPEGILDRVRLDKVVVVPDGSLPGPHPSNYPDMEDRSVDLIWGFPCELVGACSLRADYKPLYPHSIQAQHVEFSLFHELSHARYLDDLYGLNVVAEVAYLTQDLTPTATTLPVDRIVEGSLPFLPPAYLALGGELIICRSAVGSTFSDCERGAEGTLPRAHLRGERLNRATVRLQDGEGSLILGSPALPLLGWSDHLYFNPYMLDVMSGGTAYEQHSAYALNRIAGQRADCGNYNAPCNLGEYQNDIPAENILVLKQAGQPVEGAQVEVFQARRFPHIWYAKEFLPIPDAAYLTDAQGQVNLGAFPFSSSEQAAASHNRVLLLKISYQGISSYRFFDIIQVNEAYWSGQEGRALYELEIPLSENADVWVQAPARISALPGRRVEVEVRYGNRGLITAGGIALLLSYDPALSLAGASQPAVSDPGQVVTWALPDLGALESRSLRAAFTLPEDSFGVSYLLSFEIVSREAQGELANSTAQVELTAPYALHLPLLQRGR